MNPFLLFLSAAITALAVENAVFARGLGLNRHSMFMDSPRAGILYGGVLTYMVTVTALFIALANYLFSGNPMLRALAYLFFVLLVFALTFLLTQKYLPAMHALIAPTLPVSTFNTALFAAFYISSSQNFGFFQTTGYALGSGVGYTAAILIIYYARKRLAISPVPRSFQGLPILLVYLGLISLAIYGLIGHNLPT